MPRKNGNVLCDAVSAIRKIIALCEKKLNNIKYETSYRIMKHSFPLIILASLSILSLSSCVDPNYYNTGTSYSSSTTFTALPHGYSTIYVSGTPYYHYGSRWYRRSGSHYIRCSRPYGYYGNIGQSHRYHGISQLPSGCRTTYIGGHRYYTHGDTWYRKHGSRYVTCSKPSKHHSNRNKSYQRDHKHRDHDKKAKHSKTHHNNSKKECKESHSNSDGHTAIPVKTDKVKKSSSKKSSSKKSTSKKSTSKNSSSKKFSLKNYITTRADLKQPR